MTNWLILLETKNKYKKNKIAHFIATPIRFWMLISPWWMDIVMKWILIKIKRSNK